MTSDNT